MEQQQPLPHQHGSKTQEVLAHMPSSEDFIQAAVIFQQLCDGSRLKILWLLCHCEECGINIAAAVGMSTAAVSHHLKLLRLHGLVTSTRRGKEVYYTLADSTMAELIHHMVDELFQVTCPNKGLREHGAP